MYFNQLFSNFENVIINYMKNNNISPVDKIENIPESHYHQIISNRNDFRLSHFHATTDTFNFIQYVFKLNDIVIDELKDFVSLVDTFFQTGNTKKPVYPSNNNFIITQNAQLKHDKTTLPPDLSICFLFGKSNIILKINDKNELIFGDMAGFFEKNYIKIEENNISQSFSTGIEIFKQNMFKIVGSTNFVFDHDFVQQFKNISFEDIIQSRLKSNDLYKDFTYRSRDSLLEELKLLKDKYPSAGVRLCPNGMIFSGCDISLFLHSMKSMFSKSVYSNIERAINFYHIYNVLMNNEYFIEVIIHIKNKLDTIDNIMTISFDDMAFDVALKNNQYDINQSMDKERKTLFEIYRKKHNDIKKVRIIKTDDLFELYEYIFKRYSPSLSKTLDKPVNKMTLDDAKVLLMYNF